MTTTRSFHPWPFGTASMACNFMVSPTLSVVSRGESFTAATDTGPLAHGDVASEKSTHPIATITPATDRPTRVRIRTIEVALMCTHHPKVRALAKDIPASQATCRDKRATAIGHLT